jgi:hypothetical protein
MEDLLPTEVIREVRDHFLAGVTDAELGFRYGEADEDSLTGALGQSLLMPPRELLIPTGRFVWETHSFKVRGRGSGAPERALGIDGVFELEVVDLVRHIGRRKGLLFQAKKNWKGTDSDLLGQVALMAQLERDSIVIDYRKDGYSAVDARDVIEAGANRKAISSDKSLRLAEVLGEQFLKCTRGVVDMRYDDLTKKLVVPASAFQGQVSSAMAEHVIITTIQRFA